MGRFIPACPKSLRLAPGVGRPPSHLPGKNARTSNDSLPSAESRPWPCVLLRLVPKAQGLPALNDPSGLCPDKARVGARSFS
jgi:hypothetical protein